MVEKQSMIKAARRTALEMSFIIFLFYSNLLMGQYTRNDTGHVRSLFVALSNIFSIENLAIAVVCAFIGHALFDRIRRRL